MNPTDLKVDEVLADKDDDLKPLEQEETPEQPEQPEIPEVSEDDKEEGYTATDVEPEQEEAAPETPKQELTDELKYIVENLPGINTRILVDGQVKEVSVKSYTQLPQDVQFATPRDQLAFLNAMTAQENRAQELQRDFRGKAQADQTADFERRENAAIREDIAALQRENQLPKFKLSPDDPGFEDDPGSKEVQKVLDFMNKKNQEYLERYNKGLAYRHIGFTEAYYMMPETQQKQVKQEALKQEDKDRKDKASRVQGTTGLSNYNIKKATVARGTSLDAIVEKWEQTL